MGLNGKSNRGQLRKLQDKCLARLMIPCDQVI